MAAPYLIIGLDTEYVAPERVGGREGENTVLSYQYYALNPETGQGVGGIIYPRGGHRHQRLSLPGFIRESLIAARRGGAIGPRQRIRSVVLCAHFSLADLPMFKDFSRTIRNRTDTIRRTYATSTLPTGIEVPLRSGLAPVNVWIVDTILLSPEKTSLAMIGDTLGLPKIELPDGYSKDRMDLFLAGDRQEFELYAITDAEITARWYLTITKTLARELGITKRLPTIGAYAAAAVLQTIEDTKIARLDFLGREKVGRHEQWRTDTLEAMTIACQAYHGGLNTAYVVGYTPVGTLFDLDLCGAYSTSYSTIRTVDWTSARKITGLSEALVVTEAMVFAYVRFRFPDDTKYPCLPVRASRSRGLIYPLEGRSWCTGAELVAAVEAGAELKIATAWRIDWAEEEIYPLATFAKILSGIRAEAKRRGDKIADMVMKLLLNSLYGKLSQAVSEMKIIKDGGAIRKRIFDGRRDQMRDLEKSALTQPFFASFITGLVRAALCETINRLPEGAYLATATTDGFLSSVQVEELDTSGPVARAFLKARERLTPNNPVMWEMKHRVDQAFVTRTRGTFTSVPGPAGETITAKAGLAHLEGYEPDSIEENLALIDMIKARTAETTTISRRLTPLRQIHNGKSLIMTNTPVRMNMDFDLKREPINVRDYNGHLAAETRPWRTIEDFENLRDKADEWRKRNNKVLSRAKDYNDMMTWIGGIGARSASGVRSDNALSPFERAILNNISSGGRRTTDKDLIAAWKIITGKKLTVDMLKKTRQRGASTDEMAGYFNTLGQGEIELVMALNKHAPEWIGHVEKLIAPGSDASGQLENLVQKAPEHISQLNTSQSH